MVGVEVFTGRVPFHDIPDVALVVAISKNKRLERPEGAKELTGKIWELLCLCWKHNPGDRPKMEEVLEVLVKGDSV